MGAIDWFRAALPDLLLTEQGSEHESFAYELFLCDRAAMLAHATIPIDVMETLLRLQYTSQLESWHEQYPVAHYFIIHKGGKPVGRFVVDTSSACIYLIDISLLPEARDQGVGTVLLDWLSTAAAELGLPLQAHIALDHPALRLFLKKGFIVEDNSQFFYRISRNQRP